MIGVIVHFRGSSSENRKLAAAPLDRGGLKADTDGV